MNGMINRNFTIFGSTGDLTYRKLMPALYNLYSLGRVDNKDRIVAIGRRDYTSEDYCKIIKDWVKKYARVEYNEETFINFTKQIKYFQLDFTEIDQYEKLSGLFCGEIIGDNIFYYAVAPEFFSVISQGINSLRCRGMSKIVIEKPFGHTIEEAEELSYRLERDFGKENIYRIDHYLGKEMVQNILDIRFGNHIFKNSFDRHSIEHIEIVASEEVGVGSRAQYYDNAGALKDMVQNHLMQILSLVAMEEPCQYKSVKDRQGEVFRKLRPIDNIEDSLILGQYEGYLKEDNIPENSKTETFALCKIFIDNDRWQDVPFYIMTGKKMASREMNVIITFKKTSPQYPSNQLIIKIQPFEGVELKFNIKKPGETQGIKEAHMDFSQSSKALLNTPEAYERLIAAAMESDLTWFSNWEHIDLCWKYIHHMKDLYSHSNLPIYSYDIGSKGPSIINKFINSDYSQMYCRI